MRIRVCVVAGFVALFGGGGLGSEAKGSPEAGAADELYAIDPVGTIVLQPDGKIVAANGRYPHRGRLSVIDGRSGAFGVAQGGIFRFNSDGCLDRGFACRMGPKTEGVVVLWEGVFHTQIALQPDGRLLAEGEHGEPVRLLPDGSLDATFLIDHIATNGPTVHADRNVLREFGVGADGAIVWCKDSGEMEPQVSGFGYYGPLRAVQRFGASGRFLGFTRPGDGIPMGGMFTDVGFSLQRPYHAVGPDGRLEPFRWDYIYPIPAKVLLAPLRGTLEQQFLRPGASEAVQAMFDEVPLELCRYAVRLPDGGAIVAVVEGYGVGRFMRFDKQWQVDWSFTNRFEIHHPGRFALAVDGEGRLLVAGTVAKLNGEACSRVARLRPDGGIDRSFRVDLSSGWGGPVVGALSVQPDGRILIGGSFSEVNGVPCANFARLQPDGSLDREFYSHFAPVRFLEIHRRIRAPCIVASPLAAVEFARQRSPGSQPAAAAAPTAAPAASSTNAVETIAIALQFVDGNAEIEIRGSPNRTYVLQAGDFLDGSSWLNAATNTTDAKGVGLFRDEGLASRPMRFYRVFSRQ